MSIRLSPRTRHETRRVSGRDDARVGDDKAPAEPQFTREIADAIERAVTKNHTSAWLEIEAEHVK